MTNYIDFCTFHPFLALALYWIFWPGMMFVVAAVFESRMVHLGKGQSRMFMPGDFMLGIAVVAFARLHYESPVHFEHVDVYSSFYWAVTGVIFAVLAFVIHEIDISRYPAGAKYSPTKIAHDISGYFVSFWLIASLGVPEIIYTIQHKETFMPNIALWRIFFVAAAFFVLMTVYDLTHPASEKELLLMHPDRFEPLWKTGKIYKTTQNDA